MGSPASEEGRSDDETQHQVTLTRGFWMLETPVTQAMWASVMGNNPSYYKGAKLPVETVSWNTCQEFIQKLNGLNAAPAGFRFSLPTEAQWEYACRAGTTTACHFGNTLTQQQANFSGNQTTEVGKYPANAWSLYDMHGNVWEWCLDRYDDYPSGAVTDPTGASSGGARVIRGGSWLTDVQTCRSAWRGPEFLLTQDAHIGFRLALVSESNVVAAPQPTPTTTTPTLAPQSTSGNDPKLVGKWEHSTLYSYYFFDDGSFKYASSWPVSVITGKYTTSNGKVYLTDLVRVGYEDVKFKDLIYEYPLGTDERGEYLWIPQFEQIRVEFNRGQSYSPIKFIKDKNYTPPSK